MQALVKTPRDGVCEDCKLPAGAEALKCNECHKFCHLRCSGFPFYHLLRLASSRISYSCRACVNLEGEEYERVSAKIKGLMDAEVDSIQAVAETQTEESGSASETVVIENESSQVDATHSEHRNSTEQTRQPRQAEEGQRKKICRYYKTKTCRFGAKGVGCGFRHPDKCIKFMKHGDKSNKGCKKGKKCTMYHPPLCWSSKNEGWCDRENCKFQHLQGTQFVRRDVPRGGNVNNLPGRDVENHRSRASSTAIQQNRAQRPTYAGVTSMNIPQPQVGGNTENQQNFFDLRSQIQQMQSILEILMKDRGPQASSCRHCQHQQQ